MKRREFIKSAGLLSASYAMPSLLWKQSAYAALPSGIQYQAPSVMPKLINVFLYGGPSELAGNLSNIEEINANSQNLYPSYLDPNNVNGSVTKNNFWGPDSAGNNSAGGDIMEELIAAGDMSIYRTINRVLDDNKGHGRSVTQNLVGNQDISYPGIATNLAAILAKHNPFGKALEDMVLPVVTFEGNSVIFNLGDVDIPLALRPFALDANFNNPYERAQNSNLGSYVDNVNEHDTALEELARKVSSSFGVKHQKINDAFSKRGELSQFINANFNQTVVDANLPVGALDDPDTDAVTGRLIYPATNFGSRLKAAVSLAISNQDTFLINLGSGGLGGWDDHSDALGDYAQRMQSLMAALRCAIKHMKWLGHNNIVINVYGDFGRNVNLNNAGGWDHGNNQNLYTLGGWSLNNQGRRLGKLVGVTERVGTPFQNRQFTSPTTDSYQCEPFAIAATIYKYFGIQNPELLTAVSAIDEVNAVNQFV